MKELSIPFIEEQSVFKEGSNWSEFREFSPSGLVPCLIDNDQVIWDSLGITEFLAEKHAEVWPDKPHARAWARCASAEMHSGFTALREECPMNCGIRVTLNNQSEHLLKDIIRVDELWNEGLNIFNGPFLAGSKFTAADAFFAPLAFRIRSFGLSLSDAAMGYVDFLLSLESMRIWESDALRESWREPGHEKDAIKSGVLIDDFRKS